MGTKTKRRARTRITIEEHCSNLSNLINVLPKNVGRLYLDSYNKEERKEIFKEYPKIVEFAQTVFPENPLFQEDWKKYTEEDILAFIIIMIKEFSSETRFFEGFATRDCFGKDTLFLTAKVSYWDIFCFEFAKVLRLPEGLAIGYSHFIKSLAKITKNIPLEAFVSDNMSYFPFFWDMEAEREEIEERYQLACQALRKNPTNKKKEKIRRTKQYIRKALAERKSAKYSLQCYENLDIEHYRTYFEALEKLIEYSQEPLDKFYEYAPKNNEEQNLILGLQEYFDQNFSEKDFMGFYYFYNHSDEGDNYFFEVEHAVQFYVGTDLKDYENPDGYFDESLYIERHSEIVSQDFDGYTFCIPLNGIKNADDFRDMEIEAILHINRITHFYNHINKICQNHL